MTYFTFYPIVVKTAAKQLVIIFLAPFELTVWTFPAGVSAIAMVTLARLVQNNMPIPAVGELIRIFLV